MLKTLALQLKQYKKQAIITPVFSMMEAVMDTMIPFIMAWIIDEGIEKGNMGAIYKYGVLIVVCAGFGLFFGAAAGRLSARVTTGFAANLREAMFRNIQTFSFSNIDKFSTAGLVTRLTTDVSNLQQSLQMMIRMCVRVPVNLICALVMAFIISPRLSSIFLVAMVFLLAALGLIIGTVPKIFDQVFKKYDALNASVQENINGIRVVKSYVRESFENEKYKTASDNLYKMFIKAETRLSFNNPVMMLCVYGCNIALSWMGAKMVVGSELTTGQLTSMFSYVMNILMSLMMLSMIYVMLTMSAESAKRICEVLDEKSVLTNPENPVMEVKDGSITFENVNFKYSKDAKRFALEDIDLEIKSGMTVGIIGGTGSSKSTLVQLIPRLYDVTEGSVKVGGVDVRNYDIKTLRDSVAMVLQKNLLFAGTINENLRWGNENATQDEIIEACKLAQAHEFVSSFPDGYETHIEQGGNNVSGGQKQRLCIARALLKKPKVLILDDSTSAVDTKTDAFIREGFKSYIPETTKIIIAQRISSVQDADLIIVMNNGKIESAGTHDELLNNSQIYREVYEQQVGGVK